MRLISDELLRRFSNLADNEGITPLETRAAVNRLKVEYGRVPTLEEVADYLEGQVEWLKLNKRKRAGEVKINVVETPAGRLASKIGKSVNAIFQKRKGVNQ